MKPAFTRESLGPALAAHPVFGVIPAVTAPMLALSSDPGTSLAELVSFVKARPPLAGAMLALANSEAYGFRHRIETIERTVVLLGWNAARILALAAIVLDRMQEADPHLAAHSLRTASITRFLALELGVPRAEEVTAECMVHDVGRLVLSECFPGLAVRVKQYLIDAGVPAHVAEQKILGTDHGQIGGWALRAWGLPRDMRTPLASHHDFRPGTYLSRKTALIHLADVLALATDVRGPAWEKVPELSPAALETLGLSEVDLRYLLQAIIRRRFDERVHGRQSAPR
jgi:HD-like signal output (HDOD) protein